MSKTIWKFELATVDFQTIRMPEGAELLTVQLQNGLPCLWALVDPASKIDLVNIDIFGTGHQMSEGKRNYIGTYQLMGGGLVFHVFQNFNS